MFQVHKHIMKKDKFIVLWYNIAALIAALLHFHCALYWCHRTNETALTFPLTFAFSFIVFAMISCTGIVVYKLKRIPDDYHDNKQKRRLILELVSSIIISGVITFLYFQAFSPTVQDASNSGLALSFAISLSFLLYTFLICVSLVIHCIRKK